MTPSRAPATFLLFVITAMTIACEGDSRGPSTAEERRRAVEIARRLEQAPLSETAREDRDWLYRWMDEVPDLRFPNCADLLGPEMGSEYPYTRVIQDQVIFSSAAFVVEHQEKARDEGSVYAAGVEGALRAYEALAGSKPDARSQALEDLRARRGRGELSGHIVALAKERCPRSKQDLIALTGGAAAGLLLGSVIAWISRRREERRARIAGGAVVPARGLAPSMARGIVFGCVLYYAIAGTALHFLEPEFDPRYRFMSEYVWGAYGWLMTTTFFVLGAAASTVALALRRVLRPSAGVRLGFGLLVVGAVFVCLAGVFREFLLHLAASAVALPSVVMGTLVFAWTFRASPAMRALHLPALLIAVSMLGLLILLMNNIGMPGLLQRIFLALFLLWLAMSIARAARSLAV